MAFRLADNVQQVSTTTGTGTLNLSPNGSASETRDFVAGLGLGTGQTAEVPYWIQDGPDFEGGLGTITEGDPDTLSRDTVKVSSNNNNLVDFGSGEKTVILSVQAWMLETLVNKEPAGTVLQEKETATGVELSTNSATYENLGINISITPKYANSMLRVFAYMNRVQTELISGSEQFRNGNLRFRNTTDSDNSSTSTVGMRVDNANTGDDQRTIQPVMIQAEFTVDSTAERTIELQGEVNSTNVRMRLMQATRLVVQEIKQ